MKGKWAQGIEPRNFVWVLKDRLAICERPGGYGVSHRRVRRQEEIIWIREQSFARVISLIAAPHNLHNYSEMSVAWNHVPIPGETEGLAAQQGLYDFINGELSSGSKLLVHREEVGDQIGGLMAGYLLWAGLIDDAPEAVVVWERLVKRRLGPVGRNYVANVAELEKPEATA